MTTIAERIGLVAHAAGATVTAAPTVTVSGTETTVIVPTTDVRAVTRCLDAILARTGSLRVTELPHLTDSGTVQLVTSVVPTIAVTAVGEGEQTVVGGSASWHGMVGHHTLVAGDGLPPLAAALAQPLAAPADAPAKAKINPLAMVSGLRPAPAPLGASPAADVAEYLPALSRLRDSRAFEALCLATKLARNDSHMVPDARGYDVVSRASVRALPTLQSAHVGPRGLVLTFAAIPVGVSAEDWDKATPALAAALGVAPNGVTVDHLADGRVTVCTGDRDPFARIVVPTTLAEVPTHADKLYVGARADGTGAWMQLADSPSLLVTGLPGTGKTAAVCSIVGCVAATRPTHLIVASGKDSDDMDSIGRDAATYIVGSTAADREALSDALDKVIVDRTRESRTWLDKHGQSNYWALAPEHRPPLIVVVLDEAHRYLSGGATTPEGKAAKRLAPLLAELVTAGRSLGVWTVLATQRPSSKALDTDLRESVTNHIALRQSQSTAKMSLPDGSFDPEIADLDPSRIPAQARGRAVATVIGSSQLAQVQLLHLRGPEAVSDRGRAPLSDTDSAKRVMSA